MKSFSHRDPVLTAGLSPENPVPCFSNRRLPVDLAVIVHPCGDRIEKHRPRGERRSTTGHKTPSVRCLCQRAACGHHQRSCRPQITFCRQDMLPRGAISLFPEGTNDVPASIASEGVREPGSKCGRQIMEQGFMSGLPVGAILMLLVERSMLCRARIPMNGQSGVPYSLVRDEIETDIPFDLCLCSRSGVQQNRPCPGPQQFRLAIKCRGDHPCGTNHRYHHWLGARTKDAQKQFNA